jgi:hypothetical protein
MTATVRLHALRQRPPFTMPAAAWDALDQLARTARAASFSESPRSTAKHEGGGLA